MNKTPKSGKVIVVSAPSGSGKSTIINHILDEGLLDLRFSTSATNRTPRAGEKDGEEYHFLTTQQFRDGIAQGQFLEWEQVYPGRYYGTLRCEVQRAIDEGHNVVLDIDVKGALNVKKIFGPQAITIFIKAPTIDDLRQRLIGRGTDSPEIIEERVAKAEYEWSFAPQFDFTIINGKDVDVAIEKVHELIANFIDS